jgi:hypothetical protein
MSNTSFATYIAFLRENISNLVDYKRSLGCLEPQLSQMKQDLFNADPFVVYNASLAATGEFADKALYH